jgi:hypothetical protein
MFTTSGTARLLSLLIMPGLFAIPILGCVSSSKYEAAKKEVQDLQRELREERLKSLGERLKQMESLVTRLGSMADRYDGMAKSCNDLRDELTILRVSREMERMKGAGGRTGIIVEGEMPRTTPPAK